MHLPVFLPRPATAGAIVLAACAATGAIAAQAYPPVLAQVLGPNVRIVKQFPAASGLTGWVLAQGAQYTVVYTTADKKTVVAGTLIGDGGRNLSQQYEEQFVPRPDFSQAYAQLEKSAWVAEGTMANPKGVLYAFVDPNCPFCHMTWKAVQPYEAAGLQVRWIQVATLGPTSLPKAIEVLAAADKTAAYRRMEANYGKPWQPSKDSAEATHPAAVEAIRQNGELMERFQIGGTPGVVWRDRAGQVHVKSGMPRLSELPAITGLPEQKIDDPSLAKFR